MSKTLYVSDLDGTLLTPQQEVSAFTAQTINTLVDNGLHFCYATGRPYAGAALVTGALSPHIPAIVFGGALIWDQADRKILFSQFFAPDAQDEIRNLLRAHSVSPIVYAYINGAERCSFLTQPLHPAAAAFLESRKTDGTQRPLTDPAALYDGQALNFTCFGEEAVLRPLYDALKDVYSCVYYRYPYSGAPCLEIMPCGIDKAQAILRLKDLLGCDRIVCFGDGVNDLPMFALADESYAPENADPTVKAAATGVIESNAHDGVAHWLLEHAAL